MRRDLRYSLGAAGGTDAALFARKRYRQLFAALLTRKDDKPVGENTAAKKKASIS